MAPKIVRGEGASIRHARNTFTFDGTAGDGAVGDSTIFSITGRIQLVDFTAFCTSGLGEAGATATIQIGTAAIDGAIIAVVNAVDIDTNEWWTDGTPVAELDHVLAAQQDVLLSSAIIALVASQAVNAGTIVFDAWYRPITDDGALS